MPPKVPIPGMPNKDDDAKATEWLSKVEDMQKAVKYLLSDEYVDPECDPQPDVEKKELAPLPNYNKSRYTTDYQRFDDEEFTKPIKKKVWDTTPEDYVPDRPSDGNAKDLAKHLMLKESLSYKEKGNDLFKEKKWIEADEMYSSGITLNPNNMSIYNNRAQARIYLKRHDSALQDCLKVLSQDAINCKALKRKATCLVYLRRSVEAISVCEEVICNEGRSKDILDLKKLALSQKDDEIQVQNHLTSDQQDDLIKLIVVLEESILKINEDSPTSEKVLLLNKMASDTTNLTKLFQNKDLALDTKKAMTLLCSWRPTPTAKLLLSFVNKNEKLLQKQNSIRDSVALCVAEIYYENQSDDEDENKNSFEGLIKLLTTNNDKQLLTHQSLAALVSLSGVSESFRSDLLRHFGTKRLLDLPNSMSTDGHLEVLIQLLDNLMQSTCWCEALFDSGHSMPAYILPMLDISKSRGLQSTAAACVMRLTTDTRFRKLLSKSHLSAITTCLQKEVDLLDTSTNSYFSQEAMLAVLYNCLMDGCAATTSFLTSEKVLKNVLKLLRDASVRFLSTANQKSENDDDATPVLTRSLSFISKVVRVPQVHGFVKKEKVVEETLLPILYRNFCVEKKDVRGGSYEASLDENVISIIAALVNAELNPSQTMEVDDLTEFVSNTTPTEQIIFSDSNNFLKVMYKFLATSTNRVTGNMALIVSDFATIPHWTSLFLSTKEGIICPLLDVIKRKRSERRVDDSESALNILAQKNSAIALAKLAKQPELLKELRAHQGFDIISTTLKYVEQTKKTSTVIVDATTAVNDNSLSIAG